MSLLDDIARVRAHLEQNGRVSYRVLKREFTLDDEGLADIVEELVDIQQVAVREENALAWQAEGAASSLAPAPATAIRDPRAYTPKHLADKILNSHSAMQGEHKQVTVMFADVRDSMELSRELDAETWHRILDGFFAILNEGVHRFEGTVNQYTGDGIMALFGAPIAHEDHAQRACYAALQLRDRLREYGDRLRVEHGVSFGVRIGINSGDVVVGRIGEDLRMDYTAQGEIVGIAQRVEQLAATGHAYLGEATERLVRGYFLLRSLGASRLKGCAVPVGIFELEDVSAAKSRLDVSRSRGLTRFVGRAHEMGELDHALERAKQGRGQVVGVVGEPGLGKSRLCYEFIERCRAQGVPVADAHCPAHGANVPYLPILELYRNYLGVSTSDRPEVARQKIAGALLLLDPDLHDTLPVLFEFMGVPDPAHPAPRMDAQARQRQLFALIHRVTRARNERGITNVILIDDLHWIDPGSDLFVAQMVEATENNRMMLLLNFRPEYTAEWTHKAHYQQLPLVPLDAADIRALVEDLIGTDDSLAPLTGRILEWTAGNPFFAEEVVQMLIETGALEGGRGARRLARQVDRIEPPANVRAVLAARIDRLDDVPKRVLQRAAVIGKLLPGPILEAVVDVGAGELPGVIDTLKHSEFIYEESLYPVAEYGFKHPLSHEVAYGSLLGASRKAIHADVAGALEQHHRLHLDEQAALIAYHWDAAERSDQAIVWHRRAAEWAGVNDAAASLRHWERVRELVAGLPDDAEALSLGAKACARTLMAGRLMAATVANAEHCFEQGADFARRCGDMEQLAVLTGCYGGFRAHVGSGSDYADYASEAMEIASGTDNPALLAAMQMLGCASCSLVGNLAEAYRITEEILASTPADPGYGADYHGYSPRIGAINIRGWITLLQGQFEESKQTFAEVTRLLERESYGDMPLWVSVISAKRPVLTGVLDDPTERSARAVELAERLDSTFAHAAMHYEFGMIHAVAGDRAEAIEAFGRFLDFEARGPSAALLKPTVLAHYAEILLANGDVAQAEARCTEALAYSASSGYRWDLQPWLALTRIATELEQRDRALAALVELDARIETTGARAFLPFLHETRAAFAKAFDSEWSHDEEITAAQRLFERTGAAGHAERLARAMN